MKPTVARMKMALALMADPDGKHWGYALRVRTRLPSNAVYLSLQEFAGEGWLVTEWEEDRDQINRPPRKYVTLTDAGRAELASFCSAAAADERMRDFELVDPGSDAP